MIKETDKMESNTELREKWRKDKQQQKDIMYTRLAAEASGKSTCAKKQLGCVLVTRNEKIVISGTNGPPYGLNKCNPCPRLDSHSGSDLQKCRAVHAERRAILRAAMLGFSTDGSTLYSYMGVPCKDCMLELWEAGVVRIVVLRETYYDELSKDILKEWVVSGGNFKVIEC
jgi:dCMP deaminase